MSSTSASDPTNAVTSGSLTLTSGSQNTTNKGPARPRRTGSPTLWSKYYEIKAVLEAPAIEKRNVAIIYDDSRRIVDMTQICPNLYIGDELMLFLITLSPEIMRKRLICDFCFRGAAKNTFYLKKLGVTHVLNTAEGTRVGLVDTNQNFYRPFGIKYKGLKLLDVAQTNIAMYFYEVAEYIDEGLKSGGKLNKTENAFSLKARAELTVTDMS